MFTIESRDVLMEFIELKDVYKIYKNGVTGLAGVNLKIKKGEIRVTDVADLMNCSKPSVNKALNNLKSEKLVNYETYGKIELTKQGEDLAKKILEAYDILYLFFLRCI